MRNQWVTRAFHWNLFYSGENREKSDAVNEPPGLETED